jgi:HSP20 family molecular chaperone IbpA
MKSVHAEIQKRAVQRLARDGEGYEIEDCLAAERDVLYSPPCILAESDGEIHVQAAVPLVNAKSLQVDVMPESITIEGRMLTTKARRGDRIYLREFGGEQLLRQFYLPARIDPKCAKATLENGVLDITVKKAAMSLASPIVEEVKSAKHSAASTSGGVWTSCNACGRD